MLTNLPLLSQDPLWALQAEFQKDLRPFKMDLVIGVYRDDAGHTQTLAAVQKAEQRLAAEGGPKTYRALAGNAAFNDGMAKFLLGHSPSRLDRQHTMQAVGGTGALRLLAEFIARAHPQATVWSSDPGYINHRPIFEAAGLRVQSYIWRESGSGVDLESMMADLSASNPADVLLLHGCCHNPTGVDLSLDDWRAVTRFCETRGLVPLVDMAYQGFGDGIDEDAAGLRLLVDGLDTVLVASSCSKNMGLYCERVGAATVVGASKSRIAPVGSVLERIARTNYSMPADHGASVAACLFAEPDAWLQELGSMRKRIARIREDLCAALERRGVEGPMLNLRHHKGMFSLLPLGPDAMKRLRSDFAIYGTDNGRLNLAGLLPHNVPALADALALVSANA